MTGGRAQNTDRGTMPYQTRMSVRHEVPQPETVIVRSKNWMPLRGATSTTTDWVAQDVEPLNR